MSIFPASFCRAKEHFLTVKRRKRRRRRRRRGEREGEKKEQEKEKKKKKREVEGKVERGSVDERGVSDAEASQIADHFLREGRRAKRRVARFHFIFPFRPSRVLSRQHK